MGHMNIICEKEIEQTSQVEMVLDGGMGMGTGGIRWRKVGGREYSERELEPGYLLKPSNTSCGGIGTPTQPQYL